MKQINDWSAGKKQQEITTIDMHTGGEPLRVITGGIPEIPGKTILEKRKYFRENLDHIRTTMMWEPRGHADMYGAIITEPCSEDADLGTFFLHNEGYSTMCGHAIIALTRFAHDTGMVKDNTKDFIIDAPPGKIYSSLDAQPNSAPVTTFRNVPSFVFLKNRKVNVDGIGQVHFDVSFGGAFYAFVDAERFDLEMVPENHLLFIDLGRRIKHAVMDKFEILHPYEKDLSFLYGTIFTGPPKNPKHHSRNVCIFANGELDRSATGSGVSARAALHYSRGELKEGEILTIESIIGTTMQVKITDTAKFGIHEAVIPEVSGTAYYTGRHTFFIDPEDPLKDGFILR